MMLFAAALRLNSVGSESTDAKQSQACFYNQRELINYPHILCAHANIHMVQPNPITSSIAITGTGSKSDHTDYNTKEIHKE